MIRLVDNGQHRAGYNQTRTHLAWKEIRPKLNLPTV